MEILGQFFLLSLLVQLVHSVEELSTGFHKKWYVFKMPFWVFLLFEILFSGIFVFVYFTPELWYREAIQSFFLVLMFANGIQHLVWWGVVKKYVPGLITAPLHVGIFLAFYFKIIF